jgi:RHS repeat-associated protein
MQAAGGIGGILALTENSHLSPQTSYFHSEGNGKVTALVDGNENVVARYLYDPFGNTLSMTGSKAALNRYRFSSKPIYELSGMYDYLYRWYAPELQRWPNRDPLGEPGFELSYRKTSSGSGGIGELVEGPNHYTFAGNHPTISIDPDGRAAVIVIGGGGVVVIVGIGCLASPPCRDALGKLLSELAKKLCRERDLPRPSPPKKCSYVCPDGSTPVYTEAFPGQFSGGCPEVRVINPKTGNLERCSALGPY